VASQHGQVFWFLTLFCGFLILAPSQVSNLDGVCRRWTDVLWTGVRRLHRLQGNQVKYVYYSILAAYGFWGLVALKVTPNPLALAIASGVLMNFALGFSAWHTLYVVHRLMPPRLRPGWVQSAGLACCGFFYMGISGVALRQWL
jgi:hypothetical protein